MPFEYDEKFENQIAMEALRDDIERLHDAATDARMFAATIDAPMHVLTCIPSVASPELPFEKDSLRGDLDIDPDDGVRMLRQVRAMLDNIASTYERHSARLQGSLDHIDGTDDLTCPNPDIG